MKKLVYFAAVMLLLLSLWGCGHTLRGTDELIQKAREVMPISDADSIDISYGGLVAKGDLALLWFISGNEYQAHNYLPMECRVVGENEYTFERTCKPMEPAADIAALQWQRGCVFLINNPRLQAASHR